MCLSLEPRLSLTLSRESQVVSDYIRLLKLVIYQTPLLFFLLKVLFDQWVRDQFPKLNGDLGERRIEFHPKALLQYIMKTWICWKFYKYYKSPLGFIIHFTFHPLTKGLKTWCCISNFSKLKYTLRGKIEGKTRSCPYTPSLYPYSALAAQGGALTL